MTEKSFLHPWLCLCDQAERHGNELALVFPHQNNRLTYAAWRDAAQQLASGLIRLGIKPGDHVALLAENRIEWPVAQMALAAMGAVMVPLNTHYRRDDLAQALQQSDVVALLCSAAFRNNPYLENATALQPQLPQLRHIISLDDVESSELSIGDIMVEDDGFTPVIDEQGPATLMFTSGTTGTAKGSILSHAGMMTCAWQTATRVGISAGDKWTSIIPLFHCAGAIMNILGALQKSAIYAGVPAFSPQVMFEIIEQESCTHVSGVPTSWLAMLNDPARLNHDLSSLKGGTCGGADANPDILRKCANEFPVPGLVQVYGQTESSTIITCPHHDDEDRFATAGPALPGYEMRIVSSQNNEICAIGEVGEIQARGSMVMLGYYKDESATAATIDEDGWLHTGDLGYLTADGKLVNAGGRLRDMIIRGGENIYPAEIEPLLLQHQAIAEVAVFALSDDYYGEVVAAAVRLSEAVKAEDLRLYCKLRIAGFKVPQHIYRVESFPLTSSGKIRKNLLQEQAANGALEVLP